MQALYVNNISLNIYNQLFTGYFAFLIRCHCKWISEEIAKDTEARNCNGNNDKGKV